MNAPAKIATQLAAEIGKPQNADLLNGAYGRDANLPACLIDDAIATVLAAVRECKR